MSHRPSSELVQSLRATLQNLEENFASAEDQPRIAELKRILLHRIADLEFVGAAVEIADAKEAEHQGAVLPSVVEDDPKAA